MKIHENKKDKIIPKPIVAVRHYVVASMMSHVLPGKLCVTLWRRLSMLVSVLATAIITQNTII